jgi:hypothetical protein
MARVFFLSIVFYLVYRLIFDLIVPVYKTTKQVKRQFNDMHEHMQQQTNAHQQHQGPAAERKPHTAPKGKMEDYIDFEEVKP